MYAALSVLRTSTLAALVVTSVVLVARRPPGMLARDACSKVAGGACIVDGSTNCPTLPAGKTPVCSQQPCQTQTTCGAGDGYAQLRSTFKNAYSSPTDSGRDGQRNLADVYCWAPVHCINPGDECRIVGQQYFCKSPDP